jgi:DNA-directed RNA polymerase subunit RPC12/RpoP
MKKVNFGILTIFIITLEIIFTILYWIFSFPRMPYDLYHLFLLTSFLYGSITIITSFKRKEEIGKDIKYSIRFCYSCGAKINNLKNVKKCPNCGYNLLSHVEVKPELKAVITFVIVFGSILSILISIQFFYRFNLLEFTIINYLYLFGIILFIYISIIGYLRRLSNGLALLRESLNYCVMCGTTLPRNKSFKCAKCGYLYPIRELEKNY